MEDKVTCHIKNLSRFHIESFNYLVKTILTKAHLDIEPAYCKNSEVKISVSRIEMKPVQYPMNLRKHRRIVYPSEARLRASTYYAELHVQLCFENESNTEFQSRIFYVPLMVKSDLCFLRHLNEDSLRKVKEDVNDPGGYFIINGKERIIRQFVVLRRNYPLAVSRSKWKTYKENYTEFGIIVRSVKEEHIFSKISLHFISDGHYDVRMQIGLRPFQFPIILLLKALVDKSDFSLCQEVLKFYKDFPLDRLKNMLRSLQSNGIINQNDAKMFIGKCFCDVVDFPHMIKDDSYDKVTDYLLRKYLLIHLDSSEDKFEFLCFAMCKLYCAVQKKIRLDDIDNPVFHEILAPGQIYLIALKSGITSYLRSVKNCVENKMKNGGLHLQKGNLKEICNKAISFTASVSSMLATGNVPGKMYGLSSGTGFTIFLQRTNIFTLAAQFNSVCKFSMVHYSKNMRKYYPEAWGFLCPVQTPEGEMVGLHNQLASNCKIVKLGDEKIHHEDLFQMGVLPCSDPMMHITATEKHFVFVDGTIMGWINAPLAGNILTKLKNAKYNKKIPPHAEVIFIPGDLNLFPGIYLFSTSCRMVRKCYNSHLSGEEFIGCLEQVYLNQIINTLPYEVQYYDVEECDVLSLSAGMIPFCENNEAVRNIFSSVKCKQALGLPFLNFCGRADSKIQHLLYPQIPLVITKLYSESYFLSYPHGTNVIIAVLSYSGFDLEDALVLNEASVQRGLMHNVVYKTRFYDFEELARECHCTPSDLEFTRNEEDPFISQYLDADGFPFIGSKVKFASPILSVQNRKTKQWLVKRYLERHDAYIYAIKLTGDVPCSKKNVPKSSKKVSITYVVRTIPQRGDKFSNRHGGKGVCGTLMHSEDLPFSEDGIVPDVIFNPHGLPSRMSIGMLYEIEAAQVAIGRASIFTVNPFSSGKSKTYDSLGKALEEAGLSYCGTQKFYSGTSGEELEADVFSGCIYYLRLHHLTEEKYQVQAVGEVDEKTYQPINPSLSGAVRFGEMERDAILSHGAMELILDRLLHNSDKCYAFVCTNCKTLLYPSLQHYRPELRGTHLEEMNQMNAAKHCNICNMESHCRVRIPYALVYLVAELAVMKVKVKFLN